MNDKEFEIVQSVALTLKKRYLGRLYEVGDLYAAGWEAVNEFHAKHPNSKDDALMGFIIRRRMIDYVRKLCKLQADDPVFNMLLFSELENNETRTWPETKTIKDDSRFDKIVRMFRPREQRMLRLYFEADMCYREIAEVMGVHESRVCQLFKRDIFPLIRETMSLTDAK
jgi:RNA polymerase sigma factor (sigma-70 family)